MRKIFNFLLALVASVGMMNAKVTWNNSNISDIYVDGTDSYSKEGVTLSVNADDNEAYWYDYGAESKHGIYFFIEETGGYTFSNTLGKNFTRIEMFLTGTAGWDNADLGDWSFSRKDGNPVTWEGYASTVDLLKDVADFNGENVKSIVFYFEGDSEEPDPTYTVALIDGTANADKVTLSATSAVEGATITVTPDEEYEITEFWANYSVVVDQLGTIYTIDATLDPATGAYSFTIPAANVTIDATIALKPVPEGDIFAGFTATAGSGGFDNEGHANLVDNKFAPGTEQVNWTKWCVNFDHMSVPTGESESCWWLDFEASAALNLTGYILTTGNDTGNEHGRNPKNWVLKAKLNADDAWTTIATVTNDVTMKNQSFKDYKFFVDQSGTYQYFRFEVFAEQGAGVMQLCELRLIGTEVPEPEPQGQTISGGQDPQNATYYYSTFFDSQVSYALPAGVEAYVATISGNELTLTKIAVAGQTIPANNAVIFRANAENFTLTPSTADAVTFTATNSLQGTDVAVDAIPANCYVLSDEDNVIGFYEYTGGLLNAHKAYITYTAPNNAPRRMRFIFAEEQNTTALDNAETDNMSVKVIENGQLVIIRNGVRYNAAGQVIE